MTNNYEKTFIIDYDEVEGCVNKSYVPPGYRLIEIYYGGCDDLVYIDGVEQEKDEKFMKAARALVLKGMDLDEWNKIHPNTQINPETDIILLANTQWGKQYAETYLPPGVNEIWTDISLAELGEKKIAAAKFLARQ